MNAKMRFFSPNERSEGEGKGKEEEGKGERERKKRKASDLSFALKNNNRQNMQTPTLSNLCYPSGFTA